MIPAPARSSDRDRGAGQRGDGARPGDRSEATGARHARRIVQPGSARVRRRVAFADEGPAIEAARHAVATIGRPVAGSREAGPSHTWRSSAATIPRAIGRGPRRVLRHPGRVRRELPAWPPLSVTAPDGTTALARRLEQSCVPQRLGAAERVGRLPPGGRLAITVDHVGGREAGRVDLRPGETVHFRVHDRSGRPLSASAAVLRPRLERVAALARRRYVLYRVGPRARRAWR